MKRKHVLLTLLLIVVLAVSSIGLVACSPKEKPRDPEVLVVGTTAQVDSLNRLLTDGGEAGYAYDLIARTVSQITAISKINEKFVGVACDYAVSEDSKTVTLTLKDGYKWHDGTPVTIDDLKFTFKGFKQGTDYDSVIEYDNSLKYTVKKSNNFLTKVAQSPLYPKHIFDGKTKETITDAESVVGAGPFKYVGRDAKAGTITFEKFANYPQADKVQFKKVVFKKYGTQELLTLALKNGEIDLIYNYAKSLDSNTVDLLKTSNDIQIIEQVSKKIDKVLYFNNQKMTNANVKRAIALAIDYESLRNKFAPGAQAGKEGFVNRGIEGYKETPDWSRNLEKAKELLKQEGYTENNKFQFELLIKAGTNDTQYAPLLQTQIEETGLVKVTLVSKGSDWQTYFQNSNHMASLATVTAGGYDHVVGYGSKYLLATDTFILDQHPNPVAHGQMEVGEEGNLTEFGQLLVNIRDAKTTEEINAAVGAYQDYIAENVLCVPFYYSGMTYGARSNLTGFAQDEIFGILNVVTFETLKRA